VGQGLAGRKFEKGKLYVVEFWATWCGPCKASMPHLSKLQKEYGAKGVTIIGVTAKDPHNSLEEVEAMVKDKGDTMGYTVAWDTDRKTYDTFMTAAGQHGIPCSYVIDGTSGKVVYIGHPMYLEVPLEAIAAGKWDLDTAATATADVAARGNEIFALIGRDSKAMLAKLDAFARSIRARWAPSTASSSEPWSKPATRSRLRSSATSSSTTRSPRTTARRSIKSRGRSSILTRRSRSATSRSLCAPPKRAPR